MDRRQTQSIKILCFQRNIDTCGSGRNPAQEKEVERLYHWRRPTVFNSRSETPFNVTVKLIEFLKLPLLDFTKD